MSHCQRACGALDTRIFPLCCPRVAWPTACSRGAGWLARRPRPLHETQPVTGQPLGRLGDYAVGPDLRAAAVAGSANVVVNGIAALREGDRGSRWVAVGGAPRVLINGKLAFRVSDPTASRAGQLVSGSPSVLVGGFQKAAGIFSAPQGKLPLTAAAARPKKKPGWLKRTLKAIWKGVKIAGASLALAAGVARALGGVAWKLMKDIVDWLVYSTSSALMWLFMGAWRFPKFGDCPGSDKDPIPSHARELPPEYPQAETGSDVTVCLADVLDDFRPTIFQDPADVYPVSMQGLLARSLVRGKDGSAVPGGDSPTVAAYHGLVFAGGPAYGELDPDAKAQLYLDVDNDFARERGGTTGVVYARAIKLTETTAKLEYKMLRPGSYLPWPPNPYAFFEHEGDGEGCALYVQYDGSAWKLRAASFGGHSVGEKCCCPCRLKKTEGSVKVYVARGSHALAPTPEKRTSMGIAIDTFDAANQLTYELRHRPQIGVDEHESVFTTRCTWGTPCWLNEEGPVLGAHSYGGYGEVAEKKKHTNFVVLKRDLPEPAEPTLSCNPEC